jgi:hypothetical protein
MQRRAQILVGGCGALFALAVGYFVLGVDVPTTTAAIGPEPQTVNRASKADRLPMKPAFRLPAIPASKSRRNAGNEEIEPTTTFQRPVLLDGCEPLVSPIGQSPLSQIPGRCVS